MTFRLFKTFNCCRWFSYFSEAEENLCQLARRCIIEIKNTILYQEVIGPLCLGFQKALNGGQNSIFPNIIVSDNFALSTEVEVKANWKCDMLVPADLISKEFLVQFSSSLRWVKFFSSSQIRVKFLRRVKPINDVAGSEILFVFYFPQPIHYLNNAGFNCRIANVNFSVPPIPPIF